MPRLAGSGVSGVSEYVSARGTMLARGWGTIVNSLGVAGRSRRQCRVSSLILGCLAADMGGSSCIPGQFKHGMSSISATPQHEEAHRRIYAQQRISPMHIPGKRGFHATHSPTRFLRADRAQQPTSVSWQRDGRSGSLRREYAVAQRNRTMNPGRISCICNRSAGSLHVKFDEAQ